jgi:hypothetical protein
LIYPPTPAYWSLVPRSSMFYLFEFCLKNMWNCSLTQHILSHTFYDWKLYELFLLSGFLIATPRNKWSVCWSSSSITYLSPLERYCFSRSSTYQWVRIVPLF